MPSTDGTGDVVLSTSATSIPTSTVDTSWGTSADRLVNTVTFTGANRLDLNMASGVVLNVASGLSWNSNQQGQLSGTINFTNTTATVDSAYTFLTWNNFTASTTTQINKTGTGTWRLYGGTAQPNVSWKLTNGSINFFNFNQYEHLGTIGLTVVDGNNTALVFSPGGFAGDVVRTFSTPVTFNGTFGGGTYFNLSGAAMGANNTSSTLNFNAGWNGALTGRNLGSIWLATAYDARAQNWFNADSSGLTSTADLSTNNRAAIFLRGGYYVLNHNNAFGTGNDLSILMGEANDTGGSNSAFVATSGHNVSGHISVKSGGGNSTTLVPLTETVGLQGAGSVNFTGNIYLGTGGLVYQAPTLALTAPVGGTATFTGVIKDNGTAAFKSAVQIVGGGKVILTNTDTYTNTTTVTGNSTLQIDGSLSNSSVTVNSGSTLQGVGSVVNGVTVNGNLAPGDSVGHFTVGSASFGAGATLTIELQPAGVSDLLTVNGALDITNATLDLTNLGGAFDGSTYTIAHYGSLVGTSFFAVNGLPGGYGINYGSGANSTITLAAIPEPATLGLLAVGGMMLFCGRRKA